MSTTETRDPFDDCPPKEWWHFRTGTRNWPRCPQCGMYLTRVQPPDGLPYYQRHPSADWLAGDKEEHGE